MPTPNRLPKIMTQDLSYNMEGKEAFAKEAKRQLRRLAKAMDLSTGTYDIRYNKGGIAVSGEATLHTDHLYIQVQQSVIGKNVMYRTCRGRKDFTGGQNHFTDEGVFDDDRIDAFVAELTRMSEASVVNG